MQNYYAEKLNSQALFQVYDTQIPRIRQYLAAEIDFVRRALNGSERVLELGAGYGRIVRELAPHCASIVGIDISERSVQLGREYLTGLPNASMCAMDVHRLSFQQTFDIILCLQNGLSAMRMTPDEVRAALQVLEPGGKAFFSGYAAGFWETRLAWFEEQADKGLLGKIDREQTGNGVIVCKDGFRAETYTSKDFERLGEAMGHPYEVREVDGSSLVLVLHKAKRPE